MSNTSTPAQIRSWLSEHPGWYTSREIAEALGLEAKAVSSAISKLVKSDHLVREGGKVAHLDHTEEPSQQPSEELEPEPGDEPTGGASDSPEEAEEALREADEVPVQGRKVDLARMRKRISLLLAKAERTENEHERDTFNAAAEKMMLRLGINQAELEAAGTVKPEEIVQVIRSWTGNYSIAMLPFTSNLARGFGNLQILQHTFSAMLRKNYIIGHKSDVTAFTTLLDSLALQVMTALRRWQRENIEERRDLTDMEKYIQHRSFIVGFSRECSERLMALRNTEEQVVSTGAALVLASKMDRVKDWTSEKYGDLSKARGGMKYGSALAMEAGREAGKKANLGGKAVKGHGRSIESR